MPYSIKLNRYARRDLEDIYRYVALSGIPGKALETIQEIEASVRSLAVNPQRGEYPKELLEMGIRDYHEISSLFYRIIYRIRSRSKNVLVDMIIDKNRDLLKLLKHRLTP